MRLDLPAGVDIEIKLMKGILGKKLGMSQVFDPESGAMTAVTVIEAGPCPVVQVKTTAVDGYDAVQLAFEEIAERKLSKPRVGHLRKAGFGPHRHVVELRGETDLAVGATVTVDAFEPGDEIKVSGISVGKGFRARSSVTGSPAARPRTARTTSASRARSGRPRTHPVSSRGCGCPGRMGGVRVTQPGLVVHEVDPERNLLLVKGSVPGPASGLVEIRSA